MRVAALVVLAACDPTLGLHAAVLADGPTADVLPTSCPPIGTAPRFSPFLHQVIEEDCTDYTTSDAAGIALASCSSIAEGPIDNMLTATTIMSPDGGDLLHPRLAPEGDAAVINDDVTQAVFYEYARAPDGTWSFVGDTNLPHIVGNDVVCNPYFADASNRIGSFTRAPRHIFQVHCAPYEFDELAQQPGGAWTQVGSYTLATFGFTDAAAIINDPIQLTADGLRAIFRGFPNGPGAPPRLYYIDRPTIDASFGTAVPLDGVPATTDAFLTNDCTRIYMSGVARIFYVEQV